MSSRFCSALIRLFLSAVRSRCAGRSQARAAGGVLSGEELEQGGVDDVGVGPGDVVRAALDGDERQVLDQRGQPGGGGRIGQDPVRVAVDEQGRHVDLGQVGAEVGQPRVHAGPGGVRRGGHRDVEAAGPGLVADPRRAQHVDVVEVVQEVLEVGRPVRDDGGLDAVEHGLVHPVGVVARLEQERRDGAHQRGLGHPGGPVGAQVAGDLAGAHREPGQHHPGQVQVLDQGVQVGGEGVVVIADRGLAGLAEAAAVVGDDPVPSLEEDAFLLFPRVPVERVAVNEHDRLPGAVVLVVDLDVVAVLPADGDLRHRLALLLFTNGSDPVGQVYPVLPMAAPSGWDELVRVCGSPAAGAGPGVCWRGAGSTMAGDPPKGRRVMLWGRRQQCEALDGLIAEVRAGRSRVLVVRGEAGIGKTALLGYAAETAQDFQVARAEGAESEMELPFAALQQLCGPMLGRLDRLPVPQRDALGVAFGLSSGGAPDRFLVGLAVLGLLSEVAAGRPLLCLVDDAQWLDQASARVLAFVARRLDAESVALLFGTRDPAGEGDLAGLPGLALGGLADADARTLLASVLPGRLDEQVRDRIIAESGGNPLALLELPYGVTAAELAGGFGVAGPLPLAGRIEQNFLWRITPLPQVTQRLLLLAAAEPVGDPALLWRAAGRLGIGADAAVPAEASGLLTI